MGLFKDNRKFVDTKTIKFTMQFLKKDITDLREKRKIVKQFYDNDRYYTII